MSTLEKVINEIVNRVKDVSEAVIWFGSSYHKGLEVAEDIDVLIISNYDKTEVLKRLRGIKSPKPLDVTVKDLSFVINLCHLGLFGMIFDGYKVIYDKDGKITNLLSKIGKIVDEIRGKVREVEIKVPNRRIITYVYK